jgi:PKD repeat protein
MTKKSAVMVLAALASVACTVHQTEEPALTGPSTFVVAPSADPPTAKFTMSATGNEAIVGEAVLFDATKSCPGREFDENFCQPSSSTISRYYWDFGDRTTGSGATVAHTYSVARPYAVTLTVTNDRALTSLPKTDTITIKQSTPPIADFTFVPTAPVAPATVVFTETSKAVAGRTNVRFDWTFHDGTVSSGPTARHDYPTDGAFAVLLTVIDDIGQSQTVVKQVPVAKAGSTSTSLAPSGNVISQPNR